MALSISVPLGADFFLCRQDESVERYLISKISGETEFQIRRLGLMTHRKEKFDRRLLIPIDNKKFYPVSDQVKICAGVGDYLNARLLFNAPQEIEIIRGNLFRKMIGQDLNHLNEYDASTT